VAEQFVEFRSDLHHTCRRLVLNDQISHLVTVCLPIRFCDAYGACQVRSNSKTVAEGPVKCRENDSYDCIFRASRTSMAFRRFPFESSAILAATSGGKSKGTFLATYVRTDFIYNKDSVKESTKCRTGTRTSSVSGAATRINRHRLLIGEIRRLVLLAQRMIRKLDMYFSIVLLRAACASRDKESASLIITTRGQIAAAVTLP
jgi:hypothetical protein